MKLPTEVKTTINAFVARVGLPPPTGDESARTWTHRLAQQLAFTHGSAWGHKSAGSGRPHSADVIAHRDSDGRLLGWDLLIDSGSPKQQFVKDPESIDLSGQVFEAVEPRDWIHAGPAPPPPPPSDATEKLRLAVTQLQQEVSVLHALLSDVQVRVTAPRKIHLQARYLGSIDGELERPAGP